MSDDDETGECSGTARIAKLADIQSLTIRDFFAGMVLAGFLAGGLGHRSKQDAATRAYEWADAMFEARNPLTRG